MRKVCSLIIATLILVAFVAILSPSVPAAESSVRLMVIERWHGSGRVTVNAIPQEDDALTNPDYKLLPFHWSVTVKFWINPNNRYGFSASAVVATITTSANTWDSETSATVFSYQGTTKRSAGRRDNYNVVAWGRYRSGVIAVTYIWYSGSQILETDTILNNLYQWSLSGEAGKMDVQNIMTHEFGHWCGLDDLYEDKDYWLTMYGYASYGETYKRDLGLGDIQGLKAIYGE
ncbi:MAG: hypothetical protein QXM52_00185 [Candidatus Bathyarchaeia archaeon]